MNRPREEQGVALLTVLLLVAVMSVLAVGLLDDLRFGLRRTANSEATAQARWYAIGAEGLAQARLARLSRSDALRRADWIGAPFRFPIDGGAVEARLTDATQCFNLNSVVEGAGDLQRRRDLGAAQFESLLAALGFGKGEAASLTGALIDWIDADQLREPAGAEDEAYGRGGQASRTAGTLLAETSELRAIRGFTPTVYARLRPYVCALPTADLSPINVNALVADRAVLLTMLTDGRLPSAAARRLVAARPPGGWTEAAFWEEIQARDALPGNEALSQIRTTPRYLTLETQVAYQDAEVVATSMLELDAGGRVRLAARRWTLEE